MARKREPLKSVGELVCSCGRKAYIEQTKRPGDFLQMNCGHCGVDTRTRKVMQDAWRHTMRPVGDLVDGVDCLPFGCENPEDYPELAGTPDTAPDNSDITPDSTPEPEPEKQLEASKDAASVPVSIKQDSALRNSRGITRRKPRKNTNSGAITLISIGVVVLSAGVAAIGAAFRG